MVLNAVLEIDYLNAVSGSWKRQVVASLRRGKDVCRRTVHIVRHTVVLIDRTMPACQRKLGNVVVNVHVIN